MKMVSSVRKPTPVTTAIDVQDDFECVVVSTDDNEVIWTEDKIGNLFQHTSSEEDIDDE